MTVDLMCRLCVIGLLPTHAALKPTPAVTAVDFNVGKQNRADAKVSGKRKKVSIHHMLAYSGNKFKSRIILVPQSYNQILSHANIKRSFDETIDASDGWLFQNAMSLEPNSVLCKVMVGEAFFMIRSVLFSCSQCVGALLHVRFSSGSCGSRCCVRGVLLEVNERLIKDPTLLNKRVSLYSFFLPQFYPLKTGHDSHKRECSKLERYQ